MALPIFYFKTGSDKLVNLIRDDQMTFAKLSINVIAWISVPNETYDFQKNLAVSPKRRITCLQKYEGSATYSRIFGAEQLIDARF
jgi:hypothetical protein